MRSFHSACEGSHTSMPMPSEYERALRSFSAVTPGPTSSLTRHMSAAAVMAAGIGRHQLFALAHLAHRDDRGVGVRLEGSLDPIVAGQRPGGRRREPAAGREQQCRTNTLPLHDRHRLAPLSVFLFSIPNSHALGMVSGRNSRVWAASLIAALAAPKP